MKIILEREDMHWETTTCAQVGTIRWFAVKIGAKVFHVRREIDSIGAYIDPDHAKAEIDKVLVREMEIMLVKLFRDACAAISEGEVLIR